MELESFSIHAISRRRPLPPVTSCDGPSNGLEKESELPKRAPQKLKRTLNLLDLIFYGVGCSVGAGIYSLVGIGAKLAGPSIALSFLLCGTACCFTSLAYAEFAARVPLAGSAYTFTYVSFGELCGWLVGWNLTLGYAVSAAVVARSWAEYLVGFLQGLAFFDHVELAPWLTRLPIGAFEDYTCCPLSMLIIGFCTVVLVTGVKESTRFNTAMTILNLLVLGLVLLAGVGTGAVNADNLQPIFPNGMDGMARGAGLVFFAYLGFDMVACLSEEVQNPKRNMPIGIIGSLMVSMSIYVAVSVVVVGMAPVALLGEGVPIINALLANACCSHAEQLLEGATETCLSYTCSPVLHQVLYSGSRLISFGAIFGLTTATFACLMGQPRIFYSMAQDGLLFKIYARVSPTTGVPTVGTIITGIFTALVACLFDLESLANAISLGTLQVFTFVNAGIILLRTRPALETTEEESALIVPESPLVRDLQPAAGARSLGLVNKSSSQIRKSLRNSDKVTLDFRENGSRPVWLVVIFTTSSILAFLALSNEWHYWVSASLGVLMVLSASCIYCLPKAPPPETFACPMIPTVPLLGILCNAYMMGALPSSTWKVIAAWLSVGLAFYFGYGIHHSELRFKKLAAKAGQQKPGRVQILDTEASTSALLTSTNSKKGYNSVDE